MNAETPHVQRVERVDDIPVLLALLQRLKVDQILDRHFPSGHRWKGELTFGEVACVWLAFITSQGDHRLCELQPWAQANRHTLQACLGKPVRPLDFHDDRLADMLDRLSVDEAWRACGGRGRGGLGGPPPTATPSAFTASMPTSFASIPPPPTPTSRPSTGWATSSSGTAKAVTTSRRSRSPWPRWTRWACP